MPEPPKIDPPIAAPPSSVTWLPGSPLLWIGLAAATFALAVGLAFGLRGGDDDGAEGAAPSPAPATTAASPELPGTDPPLPAAEAEPAAQSPSPDVPEAPIPSEPAPVEPIAVEPVAVAPVLTGFALPLVDVCISEFEGHLPGAERAYRNGTHEGLDFYEWASCAPASFGTAVLAAKGGVVVRADYGYQNLTADQFAAAEAAGFQGAEWLDLFRGRQVWIDHGGGVMTRFAHLSAIAARGSRWGSRSTSGRSSPSSASPVRRRACRIRARSTTCTSRSAWVTRSWATASIRSTPVGSIWRPSASPSRLRDRRAAGSVADASPCERVR